MKEGATEGLFVTIKENGSKVIVAILVGGRLSRLSSGLRSCTLQRKKLGRCSN